MRAGWRWPAGGVRALGGGREPEIVAGAGRGRWSALGMARVAAFVASAALSACGGSGASPPDRVLVSAAVSLTEPLERVAADFEQDTGTPVELNLAGSSTLAAQVLAGAPVDVFVSADERQLDRVAAESLIDAQTRVVLLSNRLAVVVPAGGAATPARGAAAAPDLRRGGTGVSSNVPSGTLRDCRPGFGRIGRGTPAGRAPAGV